MPKRREHQFISVAKIDLTKVN